MKLKYLLLIFIFILIYNSCEKSPTGPQNINEVVLKEGTTIIDSTSVTPPTVQGNTITFVADGTQPQLDIGDVVVLQNDGGYIKKIETIQNNGNQIVVTTSQGTIADVYETINISDVLDMSFDYTGKLNGKSFLNKPSESGRIPLDGTEIYSGTINGVRITAEIESGYIKFTPKFKRYIYWGWTTGISQFKLSAEGNLEFDCIVKLTVNGAVDFNKEYTITSIKFPLWFGGIPGSVELDFVAGIEANASTTGTISTGIKFNSLVEIGAYYDSQGWHPIENYGTISPTQHPVDWTANSNANLKAYIKPQFATTIASTVGPYMEIEPYLALDCNADYGQMEWDWFLKGGFDGRLGFKVDIFGFLELIDYNKTLINYEVDVAKDSGELENTIVSVLPGIDDFEQYVVGQRLSCQNPMDWITWNETSCDAIQDAFVVDNISYDGTKSVLIQSGNDLVHKISNYQTSDLPGVHFKMYIPGGKQGYFNILSNFEQGNHIWGMEVFFYSDGTGTLKANIDKSFTFPHDKWFSISVYFDLNSDWSSMWVDDSGYLQEVHQWQWTSGYSNSQFTLPQLSAVDFYSRDEEVLYYIDRFMVVP